MSVYLANESGREVDEHALVGLARHTLDAMGVSPLAELSVLLVDLAAMTSLHEQYMDEATPTDVLSFAQDDVASIGPDADPGDGPAPEVLLGDVVICPEYAEGNATTAGHPLAAELDLLLVHGILHLLGFDHAEEQEKAEMFGRQDNLLAAWTLARQR